MKEESLGGWKGRISRGSGHKEKKGGSVTFCLSKSLPHLPLSPNADADKHDELRSHPDSAGICLSLARALHPSPRALNRHSPFHVELVAVYTAHLLDLDRACPLRLRHRRPRLCASLLPPKGSGISRARRRLCGQRTRRGRSKDPLSVPLDSRDGLQRPQAGAGAGQGSSNQDHRRKDQGTRISSRCYRRPSKRAISSIFP